MSADLNATQLRKLARILDATEKADAEGNLTSITIDPPYGRVTFNPVRAFRRYRNRLTVTVLGPGEQAVKP